MNKITNEVLEAHLNCKTKARLKLAGEAGTPSDYEAMSVEARRASREAVLAKLVARFPDASRSVPANAETLKEGKPLLVDATFEDDGMSIRFDALKKADGLSKLGDHYLPVLHVHGDKVVKREKLRLAVLGLLLDGMQGLRPVVGLVARGPEGRLGKVNLDGKLYRQAGQVLDELKRLQAGGEPARLALNRHCQVCEFKGRCRQEAVKADDISLLGGVGEKELKRYNRKGIFTLTQLACTFRPRRTKRGAAKKHDRSLQALAIRQNTVYVAQKPELPNRKVRLCLDVEGMPDNGLYYLIGLTVVEGESRRRLGFWADGEANEAAIWAAFLEAVKPLGDFVLLHYGSYEGKFLKEMEARHGGDPGLLARIKSNSVNVLSLIYARVYFPVCSNDLKSVAGCLGFRWSAEEASGLQAISWRHAWEASRNDSLKQQLLTYNEEDREALERVAEMLRALGGEQGRQGGTGPAVAGVEDIPGQPGRKFCTQTFALPEFAQITKCSYFDHQRDKVLCRTNPAVQKIGRRRERPKPRAITVNREVECDAPPSVCPHCGHDDFGVMSRYQKFVIDLKPFRGGIKSWVTRYKVERQRCRKCRKGMYPDDYNALPYRYGWGLCSWQTYAMIALRQSLDAIAETLDDLFGCSLSRGALVNLRQQAVEHYRPTYESLLSTLRNGQLIHADETKGRIRGPDKDGYVWVFANPTTVVYVYSPTRDGDTVRKTLAGFKGVLVSDFYAAYDGIDCPQQKCLVHLVRDFNDDLLKYPFDEELKRQAARFAALLQAVVATVDRFGLKKFHLHKHKKEVDSFFEAEGQVVYQSEIASHYQQRLLKNRKKLFAFLDYDGVPWCNNNGEHAVKAFASRRKGMGKVFAEGGLQDYLLLLSIYQTLRYRNVSFWQFLQSGETDIEAFCNRSGTKKRASSQIGVPRDHRQSGQDGGTSAGVSGARTIAIGDIHGCSTALRALLEAAAPRRKDTVVTLGNYIDHGPDTQGVVRLLLGLVSRCTLVPLMGDHEEMFLAALECRDDLGSWLESGGEQTLRSYGVDHPRAVPQPHRSFLNGCEGYHETGTHLFIHAGYQPDLYLSKQPGSVLRRRPLDGEWPGPHASGKVAVVGHTPQKGGDILDLGHLVCIDTFCHGGGWLTALDVGSGRWWQANEQGEVRQGRLPSAASEPVATRGQP